jgi:hypothetical protein
MIPAEGMLCFYESHTAFNGCPETLLYILNHPDFAKCDSEGKCIRFNTLYVYKVDRFLRCMATYLKLKDTFVKRSINIWSVLENTGSLTNPDDFEALIAHAEDESKILSGRITSHNIIKGPKNCGPNEPTKSGDPWCPREQDRLRLFLNHETVPNEYIHSSGQKKDKINWTLLARNEFPHRTPQQLFHRCEHLARFPLEMLAPTSEVEESQSLSY